MRWMVQMQTCASGEMNDEFSRWTCVKLGELAVVVVRNIGHEFLFGLLAEIARVDKEEDALGVGEFQQAINLGDGGEGLARSGRHLDEGARLVLLERRFEVLDRGNLAVAQACLVQAAASPASAARKDFGCAAHSRSVSGR